ncbi:MAG: hypothetical protein ACLR8Y_03170 [Alistipes indistinctus]
MKQIDITAPIRVAVLLLLRVGSSSDRRYLNFTRVYCWRSTS